MADSTDQPDRSSPVTRELRSLVEEQRRLRDEIEQLIERRRPGNGNGDGDGARPGTKTREEEKDLKKPDEEEQEKDKEDGGKAEKPPLRRRAAAWARAHPLATIILLIFLILLIVAGYLIWKYLQSYESTDDAQVEAHISQLSSRIPGTVIGVYTENNRSVVQNQTLVDLDPRDYETALANANAALGQARAAVQAEAPNVPITETSISSDVVTARLEVANAAAALDAAEHTFQAATADLEQARASAENAAIEERRYRRLVEKEEVSREAYDQRLTQARVQEALVASRRASAEAAARSVTQRQATLGQAMERLRTTETNQPRQIAARRSTVAERQANVRAAEAQVIQAGLNLSYTKILAPVAGVVGNRSVSIGDRIAPGQSLLAITILDDIWVTANFKETQIKSMHPGQPVDISVDALRQTFHGWVQNMPGATGQVFSLLPPENATGNFVKVVQRLPVRIRFNPGQKGLERLRPGMSVVPTVWLR
jgi:membrane fusion protein (multidrug efflux system)